MKFINKDRVSISPKVWTTPNGRRIEWRSDKQTFDQFLGILSEYYAANSLTPFDPNAVEHEFCRQMPKWVCSDRDSQRSSGLVVSSGTRSCGTCGGRR